MCKKHLKQKQAPKPADCKDVVVLVEEMRDLYRGRGSPPHRKDDVRRYEATCSLAALPTYTDIAAELRDVDLQMQGTLVTDDGKPVRPLTEMQASVKRARINTKPLVALIQEATGYSFVYKDNRVSKRNGQSHCLRYFCAQRSDSGHCRRAAPRTSQQATVKSSQTSPASSLDPSKSSTGVTTSATSALDQNNLFLQGLETDDISAATIAAVLAAQAASNDVGEVDGDIDDEGEDGEATQLALDSAIKRGMSSFLPGIDVGPTLGSARPTTVPGQGDNDGQDRAASEKRTTEGEDGDDHDEEDDDDDDDDEDDDDEKQGADATANMTDAEKLQAVLAKTRKPRRMKRYDCRGNMVVNIYEDGQTASFTITHSLVHPEYVDVVGNRHRGPRYEPPPIDLVSALLPPQASIDFPLDGSDPLDRAEHVFRSLLELVGTLRQKRDTLSIAPGGAEYAAQLLYDKSCEARIARVSVIEALQRGGRSDKAAVAKSRKRKLSDATATAADIKSISVGSIGGSDVANRLGNAVSAIPSTATAPPSLGPPPTKRLNVAPTVAEIDPMEDYLVSQDEDEEPGTRADDGGDEEDEDNPDATADISNTVNKFFAQNVGLVT